MRRVRKEKKKMTMKQLISRSHWSTQGLIKALGLTKKDISKWEK